MESLKYTVIKNEKQYLKYCNTLEQLVLSGEKGKQTKDEIDLLTLLIEKYDETNSPVMEMEPIPLLRSLMVEHNLKAKDLVALLGISKSYVSDILNYRKGLSKEVIRKLAEHFKLRQEAFNRPYQLHSLDQGPGSVRRKSHAA